MYTTKPLTIRYSHTLNLTSLAPYMKAINSPPSFPSKPSYLASDIPISMVRDPEADLPRPAMKTTILSFLVKALIMAMDEHPIMRARVKEADGVRYLEVGREGVIGVAVSGLLLDLPRRSLLMAQTRNMDSSLPLSRHYPPRPHSQASPLILRPCVKIHSRCLPLRT